LQHFALPDSADQATAVFQKVDKLTNQCSTNIL
jgi:hypothetical protein